MLLVVSFYFPKLVATVRSKLHAVAGGVMAAVRTACITDVGTVAVALTNVVVVAATRPD